MKHITKLTIGLITIALVGYSKYESETITNVSTKISISNPIFTARQDNTLLSPFAINRLAENITVEIVTPSVTTGGGRFTAAGSGVIIGKKDSTYYVLTAEHIFPDQNDYRVVVRSKKPGEDAEVVKLEIIRRYPKQDLAVVAFASLKEYKVVEVGEASQLSNSSQVYVGGWPGVENREGFQFTPAKVTSPRAGDNLTYQPTETGEGLHKGMSGGVVLNEVGQLVGIHVGLTEVDGDGKGVLISSAFLREMRQDVGEVLDRPTSVPARKNKTVTNDDNATSDFGKADDLFIQQTNQQWYQDYQDQFNKSRQQFNESQQQFNESRQQFNESQQQLRQQFNESQQQFNKSRQQFNESQQQLRQQFNESRGY